MKQFNNIREMALWLENRDAEYRNGFPTVSDIEFDEVLSEYTKLTGQRISDGLLPIKKIENNERIDINLPMAGLEKITTVSDLLSWINSMKAKGCDQFVITPKYDGVSCGIINDVSKLIDNKFVPAYVKSHNGCYSIYNHYARITRSVGKACDMIDGLYHVGEIIMHNPTFKEKYSKDYKNVRNMVAGKLNPRSESTDELSDMSYMRYSLTDDNLDESCNGRFTTKGEIIQYLNDNFNRHEIPTMVVTNEWFDDDTESKLDELYRLWSKDFVIDGIVIDVNDIRLRQELGRNTVGNPRYAIAYKGGFGDVATVTVQSINYTLDKDGVINPSVTTDLAKLDGAVCGNNIFVDNIKYLRDNGLQVGVQCEIKRGGQVIPRVKRVLSTVPFKSYNQMLQLGILPETCPCCHQPLEYKEENVDVRCTNESCPDVVVRTAQHFFTTIGVKGLSTISIIKIYNSLNDFSITGLQFITDLIHHPSYFDVLGAGNSKKITEDIKKKLSTVSLATLMAATNLFKGLGVIKISLVLDDRDIDSVYALRTLLIMQIMDVKGYDFKSADNFYDGIEPFADFYNNIKDYVNVDHPKFDVISDSGGCMVGQSVCFTGFRNPEMENLIVAEGGTIKNSLTKSTTILVVKDSSVTTTKVQKAESYGIRIVDEIELREMLNMKTIIEEQQDNIESKDGLW